MFALWVYVAICVTRVSSQCSPTIQNRVLGTGHIAESTASSADECCRLCGSNVECVAYTFATDAHTCFLKNNSLDQGTTVNRVSAIKTAMCTLQSGTEFIGNDVAAPQAVADRSACCDSCALDVLCKFFTYEGGSNGLCHHKNTDAPDHSRLNASCTSGYVGSDPPVPPVPTTVHITIGNQRSRTGGSFLCWNLDASENRQFFTRNLSVEVSGSFGWQLARQAAELGSRQPAGYSLLRFGGTGNDYLTYEFGGTPCPPLSEFKQCMNQTIWRNLLSFAQAAKAKIIFGLSMNTELDASRNKVRADPFPFPWDPKNAKQILQWTIDQGLDHVLYGFELGNEQNTKYTAQQLATNFAILHNLTLALWTDASKRPLLFGPDPHSVHDTTGVQYQFIADFIKACKSMGVPLYAATHHEYIEIDPTSAGFTSPSKLKLNGDIAATMNKTIREVDLAVNIFGGEIGPHNGGTVPCDHTSMRWAVFGDSFWYADALASKAKNGYAGLCRQNYIGIDYGMVDCMTGVPLPDFYTGLTWVTTMGQTVLDVGTTEQHKANSPILAYAHCTAASASTQKGMVTVLVINLGNSSTTVNFDHVVSQQFVLSPNNDKGSSLTNDTGLLGTGIKLNGVALTLAKDGNVPVIVGQPIDARSAALPASSIVFYTIKASSSAC